MCVVVYDCVVECMWLMHVVDCVVDVWLSVWFVWCVWLSVWYMCGCVC